MHTNSPRPAVRHLALLACAAAMAPCWAQQAAQTGVPAAPAAAVPTASPSPQELEPGVNTSSAAQSPAQPASPAGAPQSGGPIAAPQSSALPATAPHPDAKAGSRRSVRTGGSDAGSPAPTAGKAHDRIELDTTQITGNRELPKVLYIVPWKRADLGDLVGRPVNSLLDEVLTPVDRDVFNRQNRYYDALQPDATAPAQKQVGH